MRDLMDNVPLEQMDPTAKFNIHEPGRPKLVFAPDPAHDNRLLEWVPLSLAERLKAQYNRNKTHFAIAQDLIQAAQDVYVARIVRAVVEQVLTERGFIAAVPVAIPTPQEQPRLEERSAPAEPEVPAVIRQRGRPKKVLKTLER